MLVKIKKVYVSISIYFFLMIGWVLISGRIQDFLYCLSALFLHELGHIVVIYLLEEKISVFYVIPFGFSCRLKNQSKIRKEKMLKILIAGPATSIIVAGLFGVWTKEFSCTNLVVGLFNLLPFGELDGGRMLPFILKNNDIS